MADLYQRQALLIPDAMKQARVVLAGAGMLGSWLAHSLVRTCYGVTAFDFDDVGPENIGTQAYNEADVTMPKVNALSMALAGLAFHPRNERFTEDTEVMFNAFRPLVAVSAVDSFEGRAAVAQWLMAHGQDDDYFIDTRAHGTVGVVVVCRRPQIPAYLASLASDAEAAPDPQCGAEGTAFVGLWVAAQVTSSLVRAFRGLPVPFKVVHDCGMDLRVMTEMTAPVAEEVMTP